MLTLRLWRALNRPPQPSPIYRRAFTRQMLVDRGEPIHIPFFGLVKNVSLIVLPVVIILIGIPIMVLLYYLALLLAPILVPVANTIYGLAHVVGVSGSITHEREQQTYDVICTSPGGIIGMHWSYCTGWIHFHWVYRYALLGVLSIGIVASVFGLSSHAVFGVDQAPAAITILRGLALAALFAIDYAQTIVLSSLITLLIPSYAESEGNARLWASGLFLALQMTVYLPTLLFGVLALPGTFHLLGIDPLLADVLIPLLLVAFFAALREVILYGLWHAVEQQLSTTALELDAITGLAL